MLLNKIFWVYMEQVTACHSKSQVPPALTSTTCEKELSLPVPPVSCPGHRK